MAATQHEITTVSGGFKEATLRNDVMEVSVIPALGGKVTSLRHLPGNREWLWEPETFEGYFASTPETAFEEGTLVGWDECLPTIAPCTWQGRSLPDHGEVWVSSCALDEEALAQNIIRTTLDLPFSPLRFIRSLTVENDTLLAHYRLENNGSTAEQYIWAIHPLFALEPRDRLELPSHVIEQLPTGPWNTLDFEGDVPRCEKAFADVSGHIAVTLRNPESSRSLTMTWNAEEHPILGLWLTRGGWHNHHHLALEPTNARDDSLIDASRRGVLGQLAAGETREWEIRFILS